eukprot:6881000-Prymnesium_polylepis.1
MKSPDEVPTAARLPAPQPTPQNAMMESVSNLAAELPNATICQRILAGLAILLLSASLAVAVLLVPFEAYVAIAAIIVGLTYHGLALADDARAPAIMAAVIAGSAGACITVVVIIAAEFATVTTLYVAVVIFIALGASRSVPAGKAPPASGLKWSDAGLKLPANSREITNEQLSKALESKVLESKAL